MLHPSCVLGLTGVYTCVNTHGTTPKEENMKKNPLFFPKIVVGVKESYLALFHITFRRITNMETAHQKVTRRDCELQSHCDSQDIPGSQCSCQGHRAMAWGLLGHLMQQFMKKPSVDCECIPAVLSRCHSDVSLQGLWFEVLVLETHKQKLGRIRHKVRPFLNVMLNCALFYFSYRTRVTYLMGSWIHRRLD